MSVAEAGHRLDCGRMAAIRYPGDARTLPSR